MEMANKTARLAKVGLSVVAGLLGLAVVMVILSMAGPAAARPEAGENPSDVGPMSAVATVTVGASPTIIPVHVGTSTITATVEGSSFVTDTFVIFTPTLGSITTNPYRYVEAEDSSVVTRTGSWTVISATNASGGEYLRSATVGDKLSYSFNGTSIALIYTEHPDGGWVDIGVDGVYTVPLNTAGPSPATWQKVKLITTTLDPTTHTVEVKVITITAGEAVYIDAFKSGTTTDSSGVVTATLTAGDIAGTCVITASTDTSPVTGTTTISITPGSPYTVTVEAYPPKIPVDGYTATITATVTDQWTNPVTDTTVVTFTTDYGELMATQVKQVTDTTEAGVATAVFTSGLESGTATITATANTTATASTHITITPMPSGEPYTVTVTAHPITIPVCGSHSAITAIVKDEFGYDVTDGTTVTFTTTLGIILPLTNTTVSGIATSTLTSEITAGIATVKATADSVTGTTNVTFTAGLPHTVTVTVDPTSIPISGFTSIITAEVVDQYSNPVVDTTPVTFTTSLGKFPDSTFPDKKTYTTCTASGVATAVLASENVTGTATITATAGMVSETTYVRFIEPTAYLPIIRKNYTDIWGTNWNDGFQVQNLGTETAGIIILYYSRDGAVVSTQRDTIAPHWSKTFYTDTLKVGDNFDGSVVIASDQPVAVIANQYVLSPSMWGSYTGVPNGALKVNVPLVMRGNSGWNTAISVQNTGFVTATVELAFQPSPDFPGYSDTITTTIPPGAARLYDQRMQPDLGPTFVGSAVVTSDQPVAAVVNETDGSILMSYTGFVSAGSTKVHMPLVMSQNNNWWTGLQVQNLGSFATDITIEFHPDPAQSEITPTLETVGNVAPGASANFLQTGGQWTGRFVGSAVVTNSEDQPIVAIVNELNQVDGEGMSYRGFTRGANKICAPLVMYDNNGWYTGLQVQNISTSTATIDLKVDGIWRARVYVAPGSSYTWYPMPWAKVGAATVESLSGQLLVGIVNEITRPYKDGENSMSYECFTQ